MEPRFNAPLARKLIEWLEENPEEAEGRSVWHDQKLWARKASCGTALCAAGAAVWLSGGEFSWRGLETTALVFVSSLPEEIREEFAGCSTADIPETARLLLGLDNETAWRVWSGGNTIKQIKAILEPLISEAEAAL